MEDEFVKGIPLNGTDALLFRMAGGPYVKRPADLTLAWTPGAHCAAELLLTEQLEFVGVTNDNIYSLQAVPLTPSDPKTASSGGLAQ